MLVSDYIVIPDMMSGDPRLLFELRGVSVNSVPSSIF
jgi:uncharacterized Zn finger protein